MTYEIKSNIPARYIKPEPPLGHFVCDLCYKMVMAWGSLRDCVHAGKPVTFISRPDAEYCAECAEVIKLNQRLDNERDGCEQTNTHRLKDAEREKQRNAARAPRAWAEAKGGAA